MKHMSEEYRVKHTSNNPLLRFIMRRFNQKVAELAMSCRPETVLDVGCGSGFVTTVIADALPDAKIKAIDLEADRIDYATKNNSRNNVTYLAGDLFKLNFKKRFDLVICFEALEHMTDYGGALEILSSMSDNFLLMSVPNEPWFRIANVLRLKHLKRFGNSLGHVNHWSKNGFKKLCSKYCKPIDASTVAFWTVVLCEKGEVLYHKSPHRN